MKIAKSAKQFILKNKIFLEDFIVETRGQNEVAHSFTALSITSLPCLNFVCLASQRPQNRNHAK